MQIFVVKGGRSFCVEASPGITFTDLAAKQAIFGADDCRHDSWFQHQSKRCAEHQTLQEAGVKDGSILHQHLRLRGGGGDGGATGAESRSSYLEMYMEKKPAKVNPAEEKLARWTTCKLSGETLSPPCVVDELGSLYNKEALVSALVSKTMPKALAHISSLKHVREVVLSENAAGARQATAADYQPGNDVAFQCPISGQPLNGQYRFCVVLPSGHVFSEKAVKQVPAAAEEYVGAKWEEVRPLNGSKEEVEALWDTLILSRAAGKKSKKDKKKQASIAIAAEATSQPLPGAAAAAFDPENRSSSGDSPPTTAGTSRPAAGQKKAGKRGVQDFSLPTDSHASKKVKVADLAPKGADKKLWASLFTSAHGPTKETYSCRNTSGRGWM